MAELSGQQVLVTGGAGFVGRSVVRALAQQRARVTVVDLQPFPDGDVRSVVGEITDPATRDAAVHEGLDGIVHLAAVTSVLRSMEDPAGVYQANVAATAGLLELARIRGVGRFLLASTNAVVGDVGDATIHEDVPLRPLTPYGATKAACEMLLSGYAGAYGMSTCALRLTNVYGQGMTHKDSLVARLMRAALDGATVEIYGDGTQRRDFVHVDDVVQGLLLAWRRRCTGSLIIGSGRSISVLDLLDQARRVTGRPLPAVHVAPKPGEMPAVVVDIGRPRAGHPGAAAVSAAAPPRAERWRDRWARAGAAARRHWLILAILAPAIALRVLAQLAYKPLLLYIDSYVYLANLHRLDPTGDYPIGYPLFLRPLLWLGNLAVVAAIQHLLGLAMGVTIYLLLQRWGVRRWLAALAAAPVLLDAYQVQIEHNLMADTLLMAMLVAVVAVLTWRPRPGFVAAAVAGLLLGAAVVVRLVGEPLVLVAILFVAVAGSGRWRRLGLAATVAACL